VENYGKHCSNVLMLLKNNKTIKLKNIFLSNINNDGEKKSGKKYKIKD